MRQAAITCMNRWNTWLQKILSGDIIALCLTYINMYKYKVDNDWSDDCIQLLHKTLRYKKEMSNRDNGGRGSCESEKVQMSAVSHLRVRTGGLLFTSSHHYSWKHKTPSASEAGQITAATVEMYYTSFWDTLLLCFYENEILQMLGGLICTWNVLHSCPILQ